MYVSGDDRAAEARLRRGRRRREHEAAPALQAELDLQPRRRARRAPRTPRSAAAEAIVGAAAATRACSGSTRRSTTRRSPAAPGAATTDRVLRRTLGHVARASSSAAIGRTAECQALGDARAARGRDDPPPPRARTSRAACWTRSRCSTRAGARPLAGDEVAAAVEGRRVEALARRGKYLIWELEDDVHLMLHLRMTGTLLLDPPEPPRHRRVRFALRRRAASCSSTTRAASAPASSRSAATARDAFFAARLGVEPFSPDFTSAHLYALTRVEPRADQGVPARPAQGRRRGQHLRRRGAVPRAASTRCGRRTGSRASRSRRCATRSSRRWRQGSRRRARRSTTSAIPTASRARSRTASSSTCARASRAWSAAGRCASCASAGRGTYVCERCQPRPRGQAAARSSARRPERSAAASS